MRGQGGVSEQGSLLTDFPLLAFHYHPVMVSLTAGTEGGADVL